MGNYLYAINRPKVLMIGLDDSGKTTFLYKLKLNKIINTVHTIGFNIEEVKYRDWEFVLWDAGGGTENVNKMWEHYCHQKVAIIFFINCVEIEIDRTRTQVKFEIEKILNNENLDNIPLLIFANKQDLINQNPISTLQLLDILDLQNINRFNKKVHIQPCSVLTGFGIDNGLKWLYDTVNK